MREGWKEVTLGEVSKNIQYGYTESASDQKIGPHFLRITDIVKDIIDWESVPYCKISDKEKNKYLLKKGDIVVARTGNTTGYAKLIRKDKDAVFASFLIRFQLNTDIADSGFVGRLVESQLFKNYVWAIIGGAAQPGANASLLSSFKFSLPPLSTQKKIADILSAYDDLIENNLKRIQLLEEQAQLMYEEWFVRLKFPGHETTEINAETGLPEGWERRNIEDLCSKITDGTHDSPKQCEEGVYLVTGKNLSNGFVDFSNAYFIHENDHNKIKKRSGLEKGDILFSNIGTLGNVAIVTENFEYSCKNVIIFKKKNGYSNFLYYYLINPRFLQKLDNYSAGVAQKFYSLGLIRNFVDVIPTKEIILEFDQKAEIIIKLKIKLKEQNRLLQEARDLLLPRLMMGMIDVETPVLGMVAEEKTTNYKKLK